MGDNREFILCDSEGNDLITISEERRCPVHEDVVLRDGWCRECELDWTVFS